MFSGWCDLSFGGLGFSGAWLVPQRLKPRVHGERIGPAEAGPFPKLVGPLSPGDQVEHKVPPLRFAPVGMTELFGRHGGWLSFALRGRVDSFGSHLCTERKDGAPSVWFGREKPPMTRRPLRFDFWHARLFWSIGSSLRG
jgi:hypothetical protein